VGLAAAGFSERVIATDRNQRAVEITRFNALLNDVEHVEARAGNLLEPVAGERFDLVLSNPPFVITPQRRLMFRDSGMRGDEFCRQLIREIPTILAEGGHCQLLTNFAHTSDRSWRDDLSAWFADLGCDALVFVTRQQRIDEYAMNWITTTESQDATVVPRMFDEWMEFYENEQIEKISYLLVTLRKRENVRNWIHIDDEPVLIADACGDAIRRRITLIDFLKDVPSYEALLSEPLKLDADARLVQEHLMADDGPHVTSSRCEMVGGIRHSARLDVHVTRLLTYCDGKHPLGQLLDGMAEMLQIDVQRVIEIALPAVRHLIERGILIPSRLSTQAKS
jgi:hypothetical protein